MTIKTLFQIILKIFGLLFFIYFIINITSFGISFANRSTLDAYSLLFSMTFVIVYALLAWLFICKTNNTLELLRLYKNFDQKTIEWNIDSSNAIKIAIIIVACIVLFDEIPYLIGTIYRYFFIKSTDYNSATERSNYVLLSLIRIAICLIMFNYKDEVAEFIIKKINIGSLKQSE